MLRVVELALLGGGLEVGEVGHGRGEDREASADTEDQEPAQTFGERRRPVCGEGVRNHAAREGDV